jgi:serine/threonine protein phosphatase PrpC
MGFLKRKKAKKQTLRPRDDTPTMQMPRVVVNTAMSTHIGTRSYQQDAAYVCEPVTDVAATAFGILCDGMGGMAEGERVSSDVVAFMANRIAALRPGEVVPDFFERAALDANAAVLSENARTGMEGGTTLAAVIIQAGQLYWLNVGDSGVFIIRGREIARVSREHNYALELEDMVKAGAITAAEAEADPRKDALISYIGAPSLEMIDVNRGSFVLESGDMVLLCSDGLTKVLSDAEVLEILTEHGRDLRDCARRLPLAVFDTAVDGMDNTTVVLMQYNGNME